MLADPLRSVDSVDIEHFTAIADRELGGLARERIEILDEGSGRLAQLPADVLPHLPQPQSQLISPLRSAREKLPLDEFVDQTVRGAQGNLGRLGQFGECEAAPRLLEGRQQTEDLVSDGAAGFRHLRTLIVLHARESIGSVNVDTGEDHGLRAPESPNRSSVRWRSDSSDEVERLDDAHRVPASGLLGVREQRLKVPQLPSGTPSFAMSS